MPKKNKSRLDDAILQSPDSHPQSANDNSNINNHKRRHSMIEPKFSKGKIDKMGKTKSKTNAPAELKGLQDSLSHFFTPSDMRRSRTASFKLSLDQPLEIAIDHHGTSAASKSISSNVSSKTEAACGSSHISPKSPHRRDRDQLEDALTKYFTPNPDKRRMHKEGEYWQMSRGESSTKTTNDTSSTNKDEIMEEEKEQAQNDLVYICEMPHASTPKKSREREEGLTKTKKLSSNKSIEATHAPKKHILKRKENAAAIKKAQLIKRAYKGTRDQRKKMTQPVSSSLKFANQPKTNTNTITNYFRPLKPSKIALTNVKSEGDFHSQQISEEDRALFEETRKVVQKDIDATNNALKQNPNAIFPPKIRIHCYEINTWYSAPYPQEYACLPVLHICDACLMYLSIPSSHYRKCKMEYPPGNEIYRGDNFSVFEVDGDQARVYCRNLCLLAKLFIDHKTLYFDVEPFLFYVLTLNDETGSHFVGYFSKEKYSSQKYNLACIMTLPCYQGRGFGRFLIDFSYLLSRREGLIGSPERPLSDLGQVAYQSYWLSAIFEYFYRQLQENNRMKQISLTEIANFTAIAPSDIAETFAENLMLQTKDSKTTLVLDEAAINTHWERAKSNEKRIWLDEEKLKWAPKVYSPFKEYQMGSPTFTPLPGITTPNELVKDFDENKEIEKSSKNRKNLIKNETPKKLQNKLQSGEEIVENSQKTPKITAEKIRLKKSSGKKTKGQKQNLSPSSETDHTNEEQIQKSRKLSPGKGNRKQKGNCKNGMEKIRKKRASSTDDDDDDEGKIGRNQSKRLSIHLAHSLTLNGAATSTSNASENKTSRKSANEKCIISRSREHRAKFNISPTISSYTSANEQDYEMEVDSPKTGIGNKKPDRRMKKFMKRFAESDEIETSSLSSNDEIDQKKRGKVLKKRRSMKKASNSSSSYSISSNSTKEESMMDTPNNNINKKRQKSIQHRVQQSSMDEEEEEDRSLCSSASPQPNGDRLPIFKQSTKELDNLLVNMGGEPDTINMGGEPGDDLESNEGAASNSFSTVVADLSSNYKTPPQLIQLRTDVEDELAEEQPAIEQQKQFSILTHSSQTNIEFSEIANKSNKIGIIQQIQTKTTATNNKITLKLPILQINQPHLKSCSPSDIVTVEMPALDAAERNPTENRTLLGDEPVEEDDEAPPMLSPQAENINSGMIENMPTSAAALPITKENISEAGSSITNDDSFKTNESQPQIGATMAEDNAQQQNTSSSSIELLHSSPERKKSYETPNKQQNIISPSKAQNEMAFQIPPLVPSVHEDYQKTIQQNIPQIRVRSESNAEFSAQPIINKLQRTSSFSFSGHKTAYNTNETSQQPNVQTNLTTLSLPTINEQQISDSSTFVVPPYNNNQYNNQQQQLSSTKSVEKTKEKSGKKGATVKEKTRTAKSSNIKTHKTGSTTKQQPQPQIVQQSGSSFAVASSSSTTALQSQWAQFAQYYQQQQYPSYQQQIGALNISQQQHQQMNNSSPYGQYAALYNWQWQMQAQAAAKFQQQNPAAAYQNFPPDFSSQWMSMVNGVTASGSTAAVAGNLSSTLNSAPSIPVPANANWPPGFNPTGHPQLRHPSSTSQSHLSNFYPTTHHPNI